MHLEAHFNIIQHLLPTFYYQTPVYKVSLNQCNLTKLMSRGKSNHLKWHSESIGMNAKSFYNELFFLFLLYRLCWYER